MSHGKFGLKAFGLTIVAALGLMAFMAAGAQANWLVLLSNGTLDTLTSGSIPVKVAKHTTDGTLLIAGVNISILCNKIEGEDVLLLPGSATTAPSSGTIAFSECTGVEKSTGKVQGNCAPINQPIKATGKGLVILHTNGRNYVLFEPAEGTTVFTTIEFSELCALTETSKVTGEFIAECGLLNGSGVFVGEDCKNHQKVHLLQQAPTALFPSQLKYGTHEANIDGIASAELSGVTFGGLSWSGEV